MNMFDLGPTENIKQVLGDNPRRWFVPTKPHTDGLSFPAAASNINSSNGSSGYSQADSQSL